MIGDFFIVFCHFDGGEIRFSIRKDWRFSLRPEASGAGLAPKK
jgi:hypothetical protein